MSQDGKAKRIADIQKQIKDFERELKDNTSVVEDLNARQTELRKKIASLKNTLDQLIPKRLTVSDHAVIRYAERVYGYPMDAIKKELEEKFSKVEDVNSLVFDGFVIKNNTLVTYFPSKD